jgi:hypothetical protein
MMGSDVDGLQSFAEDIWIASGPRVRFFVASLPTRMIVAKLGDGSLWINSPVEEVEFLHRKSRTLILTDFLQNYHAEEGDLVGNIVKKIGGVLNGGVPLDVRLSFTDRRLGREALARLLSWDFDKLIVAHGRCLEHDAKAFVEKAFGWLSR